MTKHWIRTCQECGHKQETEKAPLDIRAFERYQETKCKKCKSIGLDYGRWVDNEIQDSRSLPNEER